MGVLSSMPEVGPDLPEGCTNVKVSTSASNNKVDVTTLSDTERMYEDAPLVDEGLKQTVTASFFGVAPAVNSDAQATGWICSEVETEYAVGDFVKGTATYVYKEPPED